MPERARADRVHGPVAISCGREFELIDTQSERAEVVTGSGDSLIISESKPEPVDVTTRIAVTAEIGLAADHAAEIAAPVLNRVLWPFREPAEAHELVVRGEERPLVRALLRPGDVLPSALGQEPVVAAGDELGPVFERDPVGGLDRGPVSQDLGAHVPAIASVPDRPVDSVSDSEVSDRPGCPVSHEDRRVTVYAVHTLMLASPVGVDGVAEHHPGGLRDLGDDRLGLDLVEGHALELGRVERAGDRGPLDQRRCRVCSIIRLTRIESQAVPAHDRQCRTSVRF